MTSFRKPYVVLKESNSSYVDGEWVRGNRSSATINATVQPINGKEIDLIADTGGRSFSDFMRVYTDSLLTISIEGGDTQSDIVVFNGFGYEVVSIQPWQSGVIPHYKYIVRKTLIFTSVRDWIDGITKRGQTHG